MNDYNYNRKIKNTWKILKSLKCSLCKYKNKNSSYECDYKCVALLAQLRKMEIERDTCLGIEEIRNLDINKQPVDVSKIITQASLEKIDKKVLKKTISQEWKKLECYNCSFCHNNIRTCKHCKNTLLNIKKMEEFVQSNNEVKNV